MLEEVPEESFKEALKEVLLEEVLLEEVLGEVLFEEVLLEEVLEEVLLEEVLLVAEVLLEEELLLEGVLLEGLPKRISFTFGWYRLRKTKARGAASISQRKRYLDTSRVKHQDPNSRGNRGPLWDDEKHVAPKNRKNTDQ